MTTAASHREGLADPIAFEVVKNALIATADEMAVTVVRTAHSQILRDNMDFSTAICDPRGRLVAQGLCLPLHLGALPDAMAAVLEKYADDVNPGDVFIHNDPLEGGMHLPDIFMFKPVFGGERLLGFTACVAHYPDIGGRAAGGNAVDSTEIYAEGLQIPILKLYDRGERDETLVALLAKNVRVPELVLGDLRAQEAACHTGEAHLLKLVERHSAERLEGLVDEILDYTERMVRAEIEAMPDGSYSFADHIDDDGFGSGPIPIKVTITIAGDELEADFEGTSAQVRSALNGTVSWAKSVVYIALKCVMDQQIVSNDGFYRPIEVKVPAGTILNPHHPAARAARGLTGFRAIDVVFGALHGALPDRVWAAGEGSATMIAMGGSYPDRRPFVFVEFSCGSWGARPAQDGVDGTSTIGSNLANVPIEEIELHQPVKVERYGFVTDTGGAGKWRGGQAVVRDLRLLQTEAELQIRSDRRRFRPYGLSGGGAGSPSWNILNPDDEAEVLPTCITRPIKGGDVIRHITAGGGGFGDARERDPELVLSDYREARISAQGARRDFAVAIDERNDRIDEEETRRLRGPGDAEVGEPTPVADPERAFAERFMASSALYERARRVLPGGIAHDSRFRDPFPVYISHAEGACKWTEEGHRLIDYAMGHGALLLGHGASSVTGAIEAALARGTHFGAPHALEVEWAERICRLVPSAELVRFTSSGTEASLLAFRLARAFSGRPRVLKLEGHFHGWHDEAVIGAKPPFERPASGGVGPAAAQVSAIPANDPEALEVALSSGEFAALILEPTGASWSTVPLDAGYLEATRELTRQTGTVLIFDEVISGFRLAPGGAQELYGVVPDLTCLGKIVAGGLPGAAVAGRHEIVAMLAFRGDPAFDRFERVAQQGTFNANPISAAAGVAMLDAVGDGRAQARAAALAKRLRRGINDVLATLELPGCAWGAESVFHVFVGEECPLRAEGDEVRGKPDARRLLTGMPALAALRRGLYRRGVDLLRDGGMVSTAHDEAHIDATVAAFESALIELRA